MTSMHLAYVYPIPDKTAFGRCLSKKAEEVMFMFFLSSNRFEILQTLIQTILRSQQ